MTSVCDFARNVRSSLPSLGGAGMDIVVDIHVQGNARKSISVTDVGAMKV